MLVEAGVIKNNGATVSIINRAGVGTLHDLLALLDEEIRRITLKIKENGHPEINGLGDRGEYFIGIGFVAIQQFLVESIMFSNLSKVEAYKLGPIHSSGISYAILINSCANWRKHEPEWWDNSEEQLRGKHSILNILEITSSPS